jgi:hypothetical protein
MKGDKSGLWQYLFGSSKDVANSTNTLVNPSNLTTEELDTHITKLEKTLSELWEVENAMNQSDSKERIDKKLDRHRQISDTTLVLEDAKNQKNRSSRSGKVITGTKTYGDSSSPTATLVLTKLAFDTKYDVCSDDVKDFKDYKKFYILEDKGKYYHWLYVRTNKDDYSTIKPEPIPITFASTDQIKGTAILKVNSKTPFSKAPKIRIIDTNKHYTFGIEKGKTQGEFTVKFKSNNIPFKNTVQYIKNFELLFEYSEDGTNWIKAGSSKNELYITWKQPDYRKFQKTRSLDATMQIKCKANRNKENILESLLWWGCHQATGLGNQLKNSADNEEHIIDAFFKTIATRRVTRKREGTSYLVKDWSKDGLGYWRNSSSTKGTFARGIRNLIKEGEARCGEWSDLMAHLCLVQGIINHDTVAIATHDMAVAFNLPSGTVNAYSKTHTVQETRGYMRTVWKIPEKHVYIEQPKYHPKQASLIDTSLASNGFKKELLLVKNCNITAYPGGALPNSIFNDKKSLAQGNDDPINIFWDHVWFRHKSTMRFYDASYGQSFASKNDSTLSSYCNRMLDGLYFKKHLAKGKNLYIRHRKSYLYADHDYKVIKKNMQVYTHTTTDTI